MTRRYSVTVAGQARSVEIEELGGDHIRAVVDGREHRLHVRSPAPGTFSWLDGTAVVSVHVDGTLPKLSVGVAGQVLPLEIVNAHAQALAQVVVRAPGKAGPAVVSAPMPGRLAKILVRGGEAVSAGRALVVVEAMKMENEIRAPRDGTVKEIRCAEGTSVEAGQELVILE